MIQLFATPALWDSHTCLAFNRLNRTPSIGRFFAIISRLGDGVFWYTLMGVLPIVDGWSGAGTSLRLAVTGLLGTTVYLALKRGIHRTRPCDTLGVCRTVEPLDRFSFPSGHTLHAAAFTAMLQPAYPTLTALLIPFTILVACSRLVLGLHYPTDVLWGAIIGSSLGLLSNLLVT